MSLKDAFAGGQNLAQERRDEARHLVEAHRVAVESEKRAVGRFLDELLVELPLDDLAECGIHPDRPTWTQLAFLHRSHRQKSQMDASDPILTTVAMLVFEPDRQQFFYADFVSDFKRMLPLPPNRGAFDVIARYIGESVAYFGMTPEDLAAVRQAREGFRETLKE